MRTAGVRQERSVGRGVGLLKPATYHADRLAPERDCTFFAALPPARQKELLGILKDRFEKNAARHPGEEDWRKGG